MKSGNFKIKYIFLSLLAAMSVSCTENFRDINTNPDNVTDEMLDMDNLRAGGALTAMQMDVIPCSDEGANAFQRAQNLVGDIFSGYMSGSNNWNGSSNNNTYNLRFGGWSDVLFDIAYTKVMPQWKTISSEKNKEMSPVSYAMGQVVKIMSLHRVTDAYGPIPYSKFGQGLFTPYDSQEEVYASFFRELDEAIGILEDYVINNPDSKPMKQYDLIYEGDISKWVKFANTLKLRLAMRISYADPVNAQKYAEQAVGSRLGVMTLNEDNAELHSVGGVVVYNPLQVVWFMYNDTRMGASMESFLKGYNDPRMEKYFSESTLDEGGFHGMRNGINVDNVEEYRKLSSPNVSNTDPVLWMCAAEAYFLRAEGAARGWNMDGQEKELYETGVKTSFEQHGAAIGAYLTTEASPAKFVDAVGGNSIGALTSISPVYNESDSFEKKLERIITQKWLAMFPEGMEAWSEFRRTGYPKIFPVVVNNSAGTIDSQVQIRRLMFPQTEYDNNSQNIQKAISLLGGADNGGTRLWWDKK